MFTIYSADVTGNPGNADGSMRDLSDILADCRTAFSGLSESEKAQAAETLVGKNAMSGFLALMNAAPEDIDKLSNAIDNCDGTAESMAATMQDNLAGQLTILKSQLEELAISFGEILMPAIRSIVSHIQGFIDKLNGMDESQKKAIITIQRIYAMFLQGMTYNGIAQQLTDDGILSPGGKPKWNTSAVKSILSNEKYKGCALLQKTYTVDYLTKKKKVNEGEIPQYYVEDNHEAIIDPDTFEMVQREMEKRGKGRKYHSGVHTFSSKIRCGECGSWYGSKVWHSNSKYRKVIWQCNHKFDGDKHCSTPHLTDDIIQRAFLSAANKLLATKDTVIADGREMMSLLFDTTDLEREQEELQQETQVVSDMVQQCIYENAHVALDQTEYQKRYDGLTERFEKAKARLDAVTDEIHQMQTQRASIEDFLNAFAAMPDELTEFTLESWHGLVDYGTVYADDDIRFTFKNGQEVKA